MLKLRHSDPFAMGCEITMCTTNEWFADVRHMRHFLSCAAFSLHWSSQTLRSLSNQCWFNSSARITNPWWSHAPCSLIFSFQVQDLNQVPTASNTRSTRSPEIHLCSPLGSSNPTFICRVQGLACMQSRRFSPMTIMEHSSHLRHQSPSPGSDSRYKKPTRTTAQPKHSQSSQTIGLISTTA